MLPTFDPDWSLLLTATPFSNPSYNAAEFFHRIAKCNDPAGCTLDVGSPVSVAQDELWLHPGAGKLIVVSFTAPVDGTYDIDYEFTHIDGFSSGNGVHWYVDKGAAPLAGADLPDLPGVNGTGPLNLNLPLTAGDVINFIVDPKGSNFFDSTALKAEITVTPSAPTFDSVADKITALALHHGLENALLAKLTNAENAVDDGNITAAKNKLNALINHIEAQSGKKIDVADANDLIACVEALRDSL